ncbi:hypothetical protein BGZ95_006365 [Linnemannia exigua]|uniref:Uncharacterized protein n=1 Tax=Linnemannia exigua TaxID=604196 RepID=A0AAD4DFZ3_9FUNG|nr:hypothetical protein BGZ95_006365 [Linnemannia exigua]
MLKTLTSLAVIAAMATAQVTAQQLDTNQAGVQAAADWNSDPTAEVNGDGEGDNAKWGWGNWGHHGGWRYPGGYYGWGYPHYRYNWGYGRRMWW